MIVFQMGLLFFFFLHSLYISGAAPLPYRCIAASLITIRYPLTLTAGIYEPASIGIGSKAQLTMFRRSSEQLFVELHAPGLERLESSLMDPVSQVV